MADQIHILCVDDEPRVLEGLVLNLPSGVRVTAAFTGVDDSVSLVVVVDVSPRDDDGVSALVVRPTDAGLNVTV